MYRRRQGSRASWVKREHVGKGFAKVNSEWTDLDKAGRGRRTVEGGR